MKTDPASFESDPGATRTRDLRFRKPNEPIPNDFPRGQIPAASIRVQRHPPQGRHNGLPERFLAQVSPEPTSGCWLWTGPQKGQRYGGFCGKYAHRFSYEMAHGVQLRGDQVVRHDCDNGYCVNPAHLRLGTHADNAQDKARRGRCPHLTKLTADQVLEIRRLIGSGERVSSVAEKFAVTEGTVRHIRDGLTWKNIANREAA